MRTVKEIEVVTCDMCPSEYASYRVSINGSDYDVCSVCQPKLVPSLDFLATVVGLPIQFALEAQDAKS